MNRHDLIGFFFVKKKNWIKTNFFYKKNRFKKKPDLNQFTETKPVQRCKPV
jgi:hypothetical protein